MVIIGLVGCSGDPFYTEARQRIDGTRYFTIRKYYGGLGTLLETQVLGAELSSGTQDMVVSSWQGYALEGGQARAVQEQSVPYAIPAGYGFRGWDYVLLNSIAHTHTVLDEQGRPVTVTAPDGASTSYTYDDGYSGSLPYLKTTVTDAEGHTTVSYTDIWGRSVMVDAPDGPSVGYTYDVSDRLVGVMYGTASTVLQYDLAGRKSSMNDPDMGNWTYTYDALGNLLTQADARGCTTTLSYDLINRLENKSYSGSCGATTATVSYIYDQGTNGVGQRVRMDDGTGYTTWSYDARGRVEYETQVINGSGNFLTQWSYNSADLPVWMRYPANNAGIQGETVNYTYNMQMLLDRVYGTDTYVDDTWYDAAGRVTLRELGANYTLGQSYAYYPWTQQGGRLQNLKSGIALDTDSLQNLVYTYDAVGNVETILDYHATSNPSDPQVQTFGYDWMDRLINAQATNGETNGRYAQQSYDYNDTTGNMEINAGMSYAYNYPNAPAGVAPAHGVRQVMGGTVYNGTVAVRAKRGTGCTTMPVMKLYVNGTLRQQWTVNKNSYLNYSVTTGVATDAQVDVVFSNATSGCTLQVDYVTIPTAIGPRTVQAESGGTVFDRGAETGAPGANAFDGVNVLNGAELMTETGSLRFVVGLKALAAGYDANGNMTLRLKDGARYFLAYDAENRLTTVSGTVSASFVYNGDGQRVTSTIGTTTTYIGGYFEWKDGTGTSYYFAGAQRVAMRASAGVEFLLGDHLGSTSLTVNSIGGNPRELRYYPWGEVRWASGTTPTDYRFTGQQELSSIGLYDYGARFYDPYLNRWIQPDSIIPEKMQGTQAWDRYAYSNNNPVTMIDPSGHWGFNFSFNLFSAVTSALNSIGLTNNAVSTFLDNTSTVLDSAAMALDGMIAAGDIASAAIGATCGAGIALPEGGAPVVVTGPAGAALGMGLFELNPTVRTAMTAGNILASVSTFATGISDIVSGETNDNIDISISGDGFRYSRQTTIGRDTGTSVVLSGAGWFSPIGLTSAPLQGAALLNDIDFLYVGPFREIPKSLPIQDFDIDINW